MRCLKYKISLQYKVAYKKDKVQIAFMLLRKHHMNIQWQDWRPNGVMRPMDAWPASSARGKHVRVKDLMSFHQV